MSFAEVEPRATRLPMISGSVPVSSEKFEPIRRFDGPANGIMFKKNEVNRMLSRSNGVANYSVPAHAHFAVRIS